MTTAVTNLKKVLKDQKTQALKEVPTPPKENSKISTSPESKDVMHNPVTSVSSEDLKLLINLAKSVLSIESAREYANVIHICRYKDGVYAVATDGFALVCQQLKSVDTEFVPLKGFNVPSSMIKDLGKVLPMSNTVSITHLKKDNKLRISTRLSGITVRLANINYPKWENIVDTKNNSVIHFAPHNIIRCLKAFGKVPGSSFLSFKVNDFDTDMIVIEPSWAKGDFALVPTVKKP